MMTAGRCSPALGQLGFACCGEYADQISEQQCHMLLAQRLAMLISNAAPAAQQTSLHCNLHALLPHLPGHSTGLWILAPRRSCARLNSSASSGCNSASIAVRNGEQDVRPARQPHHQATFQSTAARRVFKGGTWRTAVPPSDSWNKFCGNPSDYWDNRSTKRGQNSPDFRSKYHNQHVWLNTAPAWAKQVVARLDVLAAGDQQKPEPQPLEAELWRDLMAVGGVDWVDCRAGKGDNDRRPDFKHRQLNLALWLGADTPVWVLANLNRLNLSSKLTKPSLELPKLELPSDLIQGFPWHAPGLSDKLSKAAAQAVSTAQQQNCVQDAVADPPDDSLGDSVKLMLHQRKGLAWMLQREAPGASPSGGILADDQGLGKTMTAIALILTNPRPSLSPFKDATDGQTAGSSVHGGTLVVCPVSVLRQWKHELHIKVSDAYQLQVHVHHGLGRREQLPELLAKYDVVLTSFGALRRESGLERRPGCSPQQGPLFEVAWWRVILDECQEIKNKKSVCAAAVSVLQADHRWCMSGTPVQNSLREFFPLLVFLKFSPWDNQQVFDTLIANAPYHTAQNRLRMIKDAILLRRVKTELRHTENSFNMPRNVVEYGLEFSTEEQALYAGLADSTAKAVEDNPNAFYLVLLQKLQDACRHPWLVTGSMPVTPPPSPSQPATSLEGPETMSALEVGNAKCLECSRISTRCFMLACNHIFCASCLAHQGVLEDHLIGTELRVPCVICERWQAADTVSHYHYKDGDDAAQPDVLWRSSAKLDAMFSLVQQIQDNSGGADKVVIFSERTATLDIIQMAPQLQGISYRRLDGTMSLSQRDRAVTEFQCDSAVKVLLVSKKAGNSGLNLTAGNHVIILDPWYNPSVDEQAIDRTHRLGQNKPVHVYKLFIKGTVEERMLKLQEFKAQLIGGVMSTTCQSTPTLSELGKQGLSRQELMYLVSGEGTPEGVVTRMSTEVNITRGPNWVFAECDSRR